MPQLDEVQDLSAQVANHCPCNPDSAHLDEYGYCEHLLGFTNDKVIYEPLEPIMTGDGEWSGKYRTMGGKWSRKIPKGAELVNPSKQTNVKGTIHNVLEWVSWRVYHRVNVRQHPASEPVLAEPQGAKS